ncbi:hypothetical protein PR202_ga22061 [Eleusine coracana subsp. coracana]|uniref:Uncharacterized protein n=1 Tax=Eleusine coracana subsp. coracana TaxID=191504 RepID=A0AAV5D324_ELECO|nr:hypothetical protein PR202_ga22061 [Eleusine coracana subsp. coracana]
MRGVDPAEGRHQPHDAALHLLSRHPPEKGGEGRPARGGERGPHVVDLLPTAPPTTLDQLPAMSRVEKWQWRLEPAACCAAHGEVAATPGSGHLPRHP